MKLLKTLGSAWTKHERTILTIITVGAEVVAIVEALKQGPKFKELADDIRQRKEAGNPMGAGEVLKKSAVPALKVAVPFGISTASAILCHQKANETIHSLASMYMLAKDGKEMYKEQVKREKGEEEANRVEDEAYKHKVTHDQRSMHVYETGHGETKFYDKYSDRYFRSDANYIDKVFNELNARLVDGAEHRECIMLNELYEELGLPPVDFGDDLMFSSEDGLISHRITSDIDEANRLYGILHITSEPTMVRWR